MKEEIETVTDDLTKQDLDPDQVVNPILAFGNEAWELDLHPDSYAKIRKQLDPIVQGARRIPLPAGISQRPATTAAAVEPRAVATGDGEGTDHVDMSTLVVRNWWFTQKRYKKLPKPRGKGPIPQEVFVAYRKEQQRLQGLRDRLRAYDPG